MKLLFLCPALLLAAACSGQYLFSHQIDSVLQHDTVPWRHQQAAWDYSNIGEYQSALRAWDAPYQSRRKQRTKEQLAAYLQEPKETLAAYSPQDARAYILDKARRTRLVIINEAHHNPGHRVFVQSLLKGLRGQGYDHLGIEALDHKDSLLNQRKYPVLESGYYSKEPAYGNLIRTALQLEYTVFAYDSQREGANGAEREADQAANIKRVLDQNPNARLLVYCGFDHAIEDSTRNGWVLAMAGRLKRMTGIDPLTIDQVQLTETADPTYDNFYRQALVLEHPSVLVDANGKAFNAAAPGKTFDAHVYHPATWFIRGRPHWLLAEDRRAMKVVAPRRIGYPCLVMAYRKGEPTDKAVPVDIIELKGPEDRKALILPKKGSYEIVVRNRQGDEERWKE